MKFKYYYLLFALSVFQFQPLYGQNQLRINGDAQFLPGELIDQSIRDINGEVAAGLRIITDLPGLAFDARNGVVKLNTKPGEYFLFLQPTERVVRILSTGFLPLELYLYDVGIRLKSGKTWQITVTGDKKIETLPVNFVTEPEDVTIRVDGSPLEKPFTNVNLPVGKHQLSISKDGYETIAEELDVSATNSFFRYTLKKVLPVGITFNSEPAQASIFVEGVEIGVTPNSVFKNPGIYEIKVQKNGYITQTELLELKSTQESVNKTYRLIKNVGKLNITKTPNDAKVTLNEELITQSITEWKPGIYTLKAQKLGFIPIEEQIKIKLSETLTKTLNLTSNSGKLEWQVEPKQAKVFINKQIQSGINKKEVISGIYLIEISLENHDSITETIEVKRGEVIQKNWKLTPHTANFRFLVNPADATVKLIKNKQVQNEWKGLKILPTLLVGNYELVVTHPDYRPKSQIVTIKRNEEKEIKINLEPRPALEKLERFGGVMNTGKALLFPGWGWSAVNGGEKSGTWITVTSLALLGGAFFAENRSQTLYVDYQKESDLVKSDELYSSANQMRQTALTLAGVGVSVWVYNVVKVAIKGSQNDKLKRQLKEERMFSTTVSPTWNGLALTVNF